MKKYLIQHPTKTVRGTIELDGSKSISNRVLIIKHLCNQNFEINGLSTSDDTQLLQKALSFSSGKIDIGHAGTCMRFLTALLSITQGTWILTGSERMQQRPIKILVEALQKLGAKISYIKNEGYPPLKIEGTKLKGSHLEIDGDISSQYITALLLVAPTLQNGLKLQIKGNLVSEPYVKMTLEIMAYLGIKYTWHQNFISIAPQKYNARNFDIEADWSAASYFFSIASLAKIADIELKGLQQNSTQGDFACIEIGSHLNVKSEWQKNILALSQKQTNKQFNYNFINCPDLAQTFICNCAALKINGTFTGLQTLAIKETNRTAALAKELKKLNIYFFKTNNGWQLNSDNANFNSTPEIETYHDHRMAMAFAPLALSLPNGVVIKNPDVVSKSYPNFWHDLQKLGFSVEEL